ncbi:MAG: glutathione S-transferase N-terminal domain-containing protein [Polyangiaceae bacterium]
MLRLITIPISHYCEKARWALDRARLPYEEVAKLPGVHLLTTRRYSRTGTVPVLVHEGGAIGESTEILRWVDARTPEAQRLFPEGEVAADNERWIARFDRELGPAARLIGYDALLPESEIFLKQMQRVYSGAARAVLPALLPLAGKGIRKRYRVSSERAKSKRALCQQLFDDVASTLETSGAPYLLGERFSAADLTFASLAGPLVLPPSYGGRFLPKAELPAAFQALVDEFSAHPAGRFALRIYERHR